MAIAIIDTWVNDPKRAYDLGRQLYDQYGENKLLKALFSKGHQSSQYHFNRLTDALKELSAKYVPAKFTQQPVKLQPLKIPKLEEMPVKTKQHTLSDADWLKLPDPVKDMHSKVYQLHAHSVLLFNQSRITENEKDRYELDLMIIQERDEINKLWKAIKDFHENGVVKAEVEKTEQKKIDELSTGELFKLSKNLPSYLSKDRDRLKTMADGAQKNKVIARIQEREIQFELVKKRLEDK